MKVGIMQPYLFPYIGYFQLISAVDRYVVYDDANFIKGGWVNRNYILVQGERHLISMSLKSASPNKKFNEIEICDNFSKIRKTIYYNYSKAPYYHEVMPLIEKILAFPKKNLALFLRNSLELILKYLGVKTEIYFSSQLNRSFHGNAQEKVIEMCQLLSANIYINAINGKSLYDKNIFKRNNLELYFIETLPVSYKQLNTDRFIDNLSIIDILMNNSCEEITMLLNKYQLV